MQSAYLFAIFHLKHKKITISRGFNLISNSWQKWRPCLVTSQALSAAPPLIKYSSPCREDQRLSTESKIFSNYCNISKTLGGVHPPPSYHGGGMNLHVRPRVNYILDKCKLPQQWKFNEVSPVFKEDCCLTKSNYRKITILPFLSKVFGTLLRSRYPPLF